MAELGIITKSKLMFLHPRKKLRVVVSYDCVKRTHQTSVQYFALPDDILERENIENVANRRGKFYKASKKDIAFILDLIQTFKRATLQQANDDAIQDRAEILDI